VKGFVLLELVYLSWEVEGDGEELVVFGGVFFHVLDVGPE
jgi:hypothetical protein